MSKNKSCALNCKIRGLCVQNDVVKRLLGVMKGLEEARKFYGAAVAPMIEREFPEYAARIAVGLVGHGSECFGYDDDISKDHDYETGVCLFLTREDDERIGFKLTRAYGRVKADYNGVRLEHTSAMGANSQGVQRIGDFYRRYTGSEGAPVTLKDWLFTESEYLAEATNGKIFRDDLGEFSRIRGEILHGMPEDVRLKKLAAMLVRMAQTGQYNFARCLSHGEEGAAMLALAEFVKCAAQTVFLLNRRHCPYFKWTFRAMKELPSMADLAEPLEFLLTAENDKRGCEVKMEIVEDIAHTFVEELAAQNLARLEGNYLEPFGFALQRQIKSAELRNMHILVG